jgi:peptide alpha-N-acetyltransferase
MENHAVPKNRVLAAKEAANFRSALKLYESKQYKKALKTVELVLKKNSDYGEGLGLKGLLLYHLGKKDEGNDYIERGVKNDPTSRITWHIRGLYYKALKNYPEAAKSYAKSYQYDQENFSVLRDLACLQIHVKQYGPLVESRKRLLIDNPGLRMHWTGSAIAQHLAGDVKGAISTLEEFYSLVKEPINEVEQEDNELKVYKNLLIYETGDVEAALKDVERMNCIDKVASRELRAKYLLELGRNDEAQREYRALIKRNPDNVEYYYALEKAIGIQPDDAATREVLYRRLGEKYPRADVPKSILLDFLCGPRFKVAAREYVEGYLEREVPSLFVMVKRHYADAEKAQLIDDLIHEFYDKISNDSSIKPSLKLWTLHFMAQHYSQLGKNDLALKFIDLAIEHTPTVLEVHMVKAKILKRTGNVQLAAEVMENARKMDLQDRFVNSKAAKYLLRANRIEDAVETVSLFTQSTKKPKGIHDLQDMQGLWFLSELGDAYKRTRRLGLALKRYHGVCKIFNDYHDDMFDFHYYCPRRGTVRSYLNMIEWGNALYRNPHYVHSVRGATEIYLHLARLAERSLTPDEVGFEGLDEDERKKAIKKAKKERSKELKKEHEERESDNSDPDMFGKELLATKTPLDSAYALWVPLSEHAPDRLSTWQLGFEIYLGQKKYILAAQALTKAKGQGATRSWLNGSALRIRVALDHDDTAPAAIKAILSKSLPAVISGGDVMQDNAEEFCDQQIIADPHDIDQVFDWIHARIAVAGGISQILAPVGDKLVALISSEKVTLSDAVRAYALLNSFSSAHLEKFRELALARWPNATVFSLDFGLCDL